MPTKTKKKQTDVRFGEPPPTRAPRYDWDAIADTLRANPGEWAEVFTDGPASTADAVRRGSMRALPRDEFEVRTTNTKRTTPRTCDLWMRYVPKKGR